MGDGCLVRQPVRTGTGTGTGTNTYFVVLVACVTVASRSSTDSDPNPDSNHSNTTRVKTTLTSMTYNNKNTRRDEMPLPAWIFSYSPFDAIGIQPQDMLPRPPAPEVFRHSLHAALYVAKEAAQRNIHVPYTLTEV